MKSILFVEDNAHKRDKVREFIEAHNSSVIVDEAWSFTSGCQKISTAGYDLLLLDVSLPTYDKIGTEPGGRFRVFGGREIARKAARGNHLCKIAFITQFNSFSDKNLSYTFDALGAVIAQELGEKYLGIVYYNSALSTWRDELGKILMDAGI